MYWPGLFGCQLLQTHLPLVKHFLYIFEFLYNSLGIGLDKENANNKWLSVLDGASEAMRLKGKAKCFAGAEDNSRDNL